MSVTRTFTVTVVSTGSGNKYFIDGVQTPTLNLAETGTYNFDQSDNSNGSHPLRFATAADAAGGTEYTTGVNAYGTPGDPGAYTQIVVDPVDEVELNPVNVITGLLLSPHGSSLHSALPQPCKAPAIGVPTDEVALTPVNITVLSDNSPHSLLPQLLPPHPALANVSTDPVLEVALTPVTLTSTAF